MNALKRVVAALLAAGVLFALITLLALEGPEVVAIRTTDSHGTMHETRTWIADHDGASWIEAANPDRQFYRDIVVTPEVELRRRGALQRYCAVPIATPDGHTLIRRLLAEKYGLADCWIGLLADTSHSIAIRLEPLTVGHAGGSHRRITFGTGGARPSGAECSIAPQRGAEEWTMTRETRVQPFDRSGIVRGPDGVARYVNRPRTVIEMLRATVERIPNAEAVVELGGERITYRQLWERAARVSGGLRAAGVRRGERVAIHLPNGLDWVLAFFGGLMGGAVVVPINTRFAGPEVDYVVKDAGARFVFEPGPALPDAATFVDEQGADDDLAALFYTSGTTGFPKGAMTTHGNFLSNTESARRVVGMPADGQGIRNLISVPLFHVTGCNSQLLPTVEQGGTTVIMRAFDVQGFLHAIRDERINLLISVPAIYWLAIQQPNFGEFDMSGVRWLSYGGAPIAPALVHQIMEKFPNARVGNGFGLTETASIATFLPHEYAAAHAGSVGFAAPVVDLDVFEPDPDTGVGELLVRGPNVVAGYWNKPTATAETFVDGWLHSGDLARIDAEGLTHIVDRKKDMINRGGENVYCVEVENALAAHPAVFEVAVIGVPDQMMGEKVGAVVVAVPGQQLDAKEIVAFARQHLADFKVPEYVVVRNEPLVRNPGGKVLKPILRQQTQWSGRLR